MQNKEPKFITPEGTLMFPSLFEPKAFEDGSKEKYQCILVFPKGTDISAVTSAINACATNGLRNPSGARNPLCDGNDKVEDWGEIFRDAKYIRISSYYKPVVVDRSKVEILDPDQVYSGAKARAVCRCFSYEGKTGKGVSIGFDAVQITGAGEHLGGGAASVGMFSEVAGDDNSVAENPFA